MVDMPYEDFIRTRITELRIAKDVSEHRMSLDLGKSGSYIRGVTSGAALPSLRELFNIMSYFDMTPSEFLHHWRMMTLPIVNSANSCGYSAMKI